MDKHGGKQGGSDPGDTTAQEQVARVREVISSPRVMGYRRVGGDADDPVMLAVFVDDIEAALGGAAPAMTAPGPLRWKFDGGRGAMLDATDRIVGYYTPRRPDPNLIQEAVYDALNAATSKDNNGLDLGRVTNEVVDAVMTKLAENG